MKKADIKAGTDYAVVTGHTVSMRSGNADPLQTARRIHVTGIVEGGEPPADPHNWRLNNEAKRRTVKGVLKQDTWASDPIRGMQGETVYFEPRRVLSTWADYQQATRAAKETRERQERESEERRVENRKRADRLNELQVSLGLTDTNYSGKKKPLFAMEVDSGPSAAIYFSRPSVDDLEMVITRIALAEGAENA